MLRRVLFVFSFALIHHFAFAQAIDNQPSFRMMSTNRYARLHYENDYFSLGDIYYTQGVNLELVAPSLKKFPTSKILVRIKANQQFGIAIEHNAYTPTSISHSEILYGDRPFAAALFLKTFASSTSSTKRIRITSNLSFGIIGQAAGAHWIQETIHKWIGDTDPRGWDNQIQNDQVLNYEAAIEKNILNLKDYFLLNGFASARAGTLSDKVSAGTVFMVGKINPAITSVFSGRELKSQRFNFYLYFQPMVSTVLYDATMQGGMFRNSPYTLSFDEVNRFAFQGSAGLVIYVKAVYLEYFQSYITKEFHSGSDHHWGGIRIGVNF